MALLFIGTIACAICANYINKKPEVLMDVSTNVTDVTNVTNVTDVTTDIADNTKMFYVTLTMCDNDFSLYKFNKNNSFALVLFHNLTGEILSFVSHFDKEEQDDFCFTILQELLFRHAIKNLIYCEQKNCPLSQYLNKRCSKIIYYGQRVFYLYSFMY